MHLKWDMENTTVLFSARNNIVNLGVGVGGAVRVKSCRLLIFASTKNCGLNKSKQAFHDVFLSDAQKIQLETDSQEFVKLWKEGLYS